VLLRLFVCLLLSLAARAAAAESVYTARPDDPAACGSGAST
jgi:hypothetical protein